MKIQAICSIIFIFCCSYRSEQTTLDFEFAANYCKTISGKLDIIAKKYKLRTEEVLPVVYPECARYSSLSNVLESNMLEYYYVKEGVKGADFSIGYFQMKPSFIERLEKEIAADSTFGQLQKTFLYKTTSIRDERDERLNRMMDQNWQLEYLCSFVKLMNRRIEKEKLEVDPIRFTASAYNYGFYRPSKEIISWQSVKAFPNGLHSQEQNFAYADLAASYHLKTTGHVKK